MKKNFVRTQASSADAETLLRQTSTDLRISRPAADLADRIDKFLDEHSAYQSTVIPLTDRQKQCFDLICHYAEKHGFPPTVKEIAEMLGVTSNNGVNDHLVALERKGWIRRSEKTARGIKILMSVSRGKESDMNCVVSG